MSEPERIKTRRAAPEDFPAIGRLWRHMMDYHASLNPEGFALDPQSGEEFQIYLREILSNYLHAVFVATRTEEVVGYTIIAEMENPPVFSLKRYGFICEICVDPSCQGEGIGRLLFDRAVRWFKRRELKVIQLNVSTGNETGMKFYNQLGFTPFLETLWLDLENKS